MVLRFNNFVYTFTLYCKDGQSFNSQPGNASGQTVTMEKNYVPGEGMYKFISMPIEG